MDQKELAKATEELQSLLRTSFRSSEHLKLSSVYIFKLSKWTSARKWARARETATLKG